MHQKYNNSLPKPAECGIDGAILYPKLDKSEGIFSLIPNEDAPPLPLHSCWIYVAGA
jgi:hypothetical protein